MYSSAAASVFAWSQYFSALLTAPLQGIRSAVCDGPEAARKFDAKRRQGNGLGAQKEAQVVEKQEEPMLRDMREGNMGGGEQRGWEDKLQPGGEIGGCTAKTQGNCLEPEGPAVQQGHGDNVRRHFWGIQTFDCEELDVLLGTKEEDVPFLDLMDVDEELDTGTGYEGMCAGIPTVEDGQTENLRKKRGLPWMHVDSSKRPRLATVYQTVQRTLIEAAETFSSKLPEQELLVEKRMRIVKRSRVSPSTESENVKEKKRKLNGNLSIVCA